MSENNPIPSVLSKEMLLEIGGWRAMQEGRSLWEAGKVMMVLLLLSSSLCCCHVCYCCCC